MKKFLLVTLTLLTAFAAQSSFADPNATTPVVDSAKPQVVAVVMDSAQRQFILDSMRLAAETEIEKVRSLQGESDVEGIIGVFIPIISVIAVFLFLWRGVEAKRRVRMAMIDKGMDPGMLEAPVDENSRKYGALRWGMLLAGVGLGLLIGFMISHSLMLGEEANVLVIISCSLLFGGGGLIGYHRLAAKMEK